MNSWNGLDFLIFLIFVVNTILGITRGATKEITAMLCLSAALIFTIKFTIPLAIFFNNSPLIQDVLQTQIVKNFMAAIGAGPLTAELLAELSYSISVLINFVGVFCICEAVFSYAGFIEAFPFPYATLNRKVGGFLGGTRGYIFTLILLLLMTHIFKKENNSEFNNNILTSSYFANLFAPTVMRLDNLIVEQRPSRYQEMYKDRNLYNITN